VKSANSNKIDVKEMTHTNIYTIRNYVSQRKIQNAQPRPYLNDIVQITFRKGQFIAWYRTEFTGDEKELNFLTEAFIKQKGTTDMLISLGSPRGISRKRKHNIIKKIGPLMQPHNLKFWEDLPENSDAED